MDYKRIIQQIKHLQKQKQDHVASGLVQDFASYRFFVGEIKGLQDAIDVYEDNFKRGEEDE